MAVLLCLLVVTIPFGIWFWVKASKGRLEFREGGFRVVGLGLGAAEWDYGQLQRIGLLRIPLPSRGLGGVLAKMMSGGAVAVNVCAVGKDGKQRRFVVSRFEGMEEIVQQIQVASGLPMETVSQGLMGPKWQTA